MSIVKHFMHIQDENELTINTIIGLFWRVGIVHGEVPKIWIVTTGNAWWYII